MCQDVRFLQIAIEQAEQSLETKDQLTGTPGLPIGAVLAVDGKLRAVGHNQRIQKGDPILHAEMDCLSRAGRLNAAAYAQSTLYTTLWPCKMCAGAAALYGIRRVVCADTGSDLAGSALWRSTEAFLAEHEIEMVLLENRAMQQTFRQYVHDYPKLWNEDVGA
jgi:creatinine deaminase